MKYLSFDIECCDGQHICEFGYVIIDEKFYVLERDCITININGKLYAERKERKKKKGKIQTYIDKTNNPTTIGDILKAKGITI